MREAVESQEAQIRVCLKMAVYEIFAQCVSYKYKTTLLSKATAIFVVTSLFTAIIPFIISYKSNGFWLKSDSYLEQADVKFTHDYLLVLQTNSPNNPIECGARSGLTDNFRRHCLFRSNQRDINHDGKVDFIDVKVEVPLLQNESVYSVDLFLTMDFTLSSLCRLRMQSLAFIQDATFSPGASFFMSADLRFIQKKPVDYRKAESLFNSSPLEQETSLQDLLLLYSQRNFSTILVNQYRVWTTGRDEEDPFLIAVTVAIPENTILYRPGFWQVIKWAWIQYLSIFIVFYHIFHAVQEYIFSNQLVPTHRHIPWKKIL